MSFKSLESAVLGLTGTVFGEDVTYTSSGAEVTEIKGVFENSWVDIEGITSLKPTLRIKLSDLLSKPGKGDSVTITSVQYRVLESREDAFGGSTLILHKV